MQSAGWCCWQSGGFKGVFFSSSNHSSSVWSWGHAGKQVKKIEGNAVFKEDFGQFWPSLPLGNPVYAVCSHPNFPTVCSLVQNQGKHQWDSLVFFSLTLILAGLSTTVLRVTIFMKSRCRALKDGSLWTEMGNLKGVASWMGDMALRVFIGSFLRAGHLLGGCVWADLRSQGTA